jgi:methylenetetrahydrofolate reductase (NADPH)
MSRSEPSGARTAFWQRRSLRHLLQESERFVIAAELVTSRGVISEDRPRRILALARQLADQGSLDALSITDNPGGSAMLSPDTLGTDLLARGQEVIIHLSCKDWNRNALQSRAWMLSSEGFNNVLALSGDYPVPGYHGIARPVFDIDSVGLLQLLADMNAGAAADSPAAARADFFLGAVVTNHKRHEREVMPQYFKLRKKVATGAVFVINQVGYDARKDDELLRWMELHDLRVPVLANVYVLSAWVARVYHSGRIPGVVVTDELLALVERQAASADKGRSFFLDLAARQVAIARGLGFRGAYLGGHLEAGDYSEILARADAFGSEDWRAFARELQFPYPDEFYFFERDEATGLSSTEINRAYLDSRNRRRSTLRVPVRYRLSRLAHTAAFADDAPLHGMGAKLYRAVERAPRPVGRALHVVEQAGKVTMFGCRDCGDCSLPDIAYLCPESQCAKNQRNGPCGGTRQGACEVGDKECIWALAYERLKAYGEEESMLDGPVVMNDNALQGTSAWANTFLGRDHHARDAHESSAGTLHE